MAPKSTTTHNRRPNAASEPTTRLLELFNELNLTALPDALSEVLACAERDELAYTDFILRLLETEHRARLARKLNRNLKRSRLGECQGLDSYDFSLRPKLAARVVREFLNCRFVEERRNIICIGRPGLGKTRIAKSLGRAAIDLGYTVRYAVTAEMLEELHASLADDTYTRAFRRYTKPDVIILDEFGYEPLSSEATTFLFRLVSARHENRTTILCANTGFTKWKRFFPTEAQAVATVDRLIDRATILRFTGKSFREPRDVYGAAETDE